MVHSIKPKFGMSIIIQRWTNLIDFGEYRMNSFFYKSTKKNSYTLRPMKLNSLKCSSIQMVHSIELELRMYIIGHRPTSCVEYGEFRINSFFTRAQKRILVHFRLWSQIVRSMLVSKQCFRLGSNLVCSL